MADTTNVPPAGVDPTIQPAASETPDTGGQRVSERTRPQMVGNPNPEFLSVAPAESVAVEQRESATVAPAAAAADPSQYFQRLEVLIDGLTAIARAQLDATQRLIPPVQELSGKVAMSNVHASMAPASATSSAASTEGIDQQLRAAAALLPPLKTPAGAAQDARIAAPCSCDETCPECQCVSANCCCFNITLHRIRVTSLGGLVGVVGEGGVKLELQIYSYVPGIGGVLYPNLGSHVVVQGKLGSPGSWVGVGVLVTRVCIPKGQTKSVQLINEAKESDKLFKDDIGSGSLNISLNCCCSDTNIISHEIQLTSGDGGKAVIGLEYRVEKVC